ncbi:hypothetical protein T439DRAFT_325367 [Meredithblackwellia eburnea MCA 4105]
MSSTTQLLVGIHLYRSLLKEARNLPDKNAATHFTNKIKSDFRREPLPESSTKAVKRVKDAQRLLRQLQATNDGYLHSLQRTLETSYERRGAGKHQLLRAFTLPSPTPHFSRPLSVLLTSPLSHTSRPPTPSQLLKPPTLPPRADPTSEEYRLLGPLIPQRIKSIKKRYWRTQVGKVRAPVAVRVEGEGQKEGLREIGLKRWEYEKGLERLGELERRAGVSVQGRPRAPKRSQPPLERLSRETGPGESPHESQLPPQDSPIFRDEKNRPDRILPPTKSTKWSLPKSLTPRLLRRRYQEILATSPVLVVGPKKGEDGEERNMKVVLSEMAKGGIGLVSEMSEEDEWWLERAAGEEEVKKGMKGKRRE